MDNAYNATAKLHFSLGDHRIVVERRLRDMALAYFAVDGRECTAQEDDYQQEVVRLVDVWSFGDWILLLRSLVFYFEDRRALVWDKSAQRQVLRTLLLPAATSRKWAEDERSVLELDSRVRNLSAAFFREEQDVAREEGKTAAGAAVIAELKTLEPLQQADEAKLEEFNSRLVSLDADRHQGRLRVLKAEQERESQYREIEHARLTALDASFPSKSDTARYILAQLLSD